MTATSKDTSHTLFELACTGGFQNIADTACTLLGNPIAIYDLSLRNIACSRNEHPKLGIFLKYTKDMELSEKRTMHFLEVNYIEQLRKTGAPILIENAATRRIIMAPIYVNGVFSGYINVVEAYSEFKDGDLELAGDICRVISVEMQKSEPLTNSPAVIRERFLAELIETPSHSREYVAARLSALKINANGNFFIAAAERKDRFSHISGNDPLTDGIRSFKKVIMSAVHHDRLVMLLDSESGIPDALSEHLASCSLLTGISNSFSDICRASAGYRQALIALDTAVKLEAPGHIFDFRSFSAYADP